MWTRARFNKFIVPGYHTATIDSYKNALAATMYKGMCDIKTSKKAREQTILRSGMGDPVVKGEGEPVTFDDQIQGAEQTWVHFVVALAGRITEEAIEDNLYELNNGQDKLKPFFHDIGRSLANYKETYMAAFLNSGTATTYHTTRNSKALFATDHPRLNGTSFSNKLTNTDFTYTSYWAAVVAAENQYDHRQMKITKRVKDVWYAPQLERKVRETLQSPDRPDTGNRAVNALAKRGGIAGQKNWTQLTDTDAWYLQLDGDGIWQFDRRKTRFARDKDWSTGDLMIKGDQRFSAEIEDPQGWFGNVPA